MIDHISLGISDFSRSLPFYRQVLAPLGAVVLMEADGLAAGFGPKGGEPSFWIGGPFDGQSASVGNGTHVCFSAPTRQAVHEFYDAALAAGGRDDGKPGLRPDYSPHYYAAFILDPDGHKIEAVCHLPA